MPSYTYPQWVYASTSTGTNFYPTYTTGYAPQPYYVQDVSFDPATFGQPAVPVTPKTDMDWLREQNDAVCALAGL